VTLAARPPTETIALLREIGVIPVIRCNAATIAVRVTEVLIEAALPIAEITLTIPDATEAIARLTRRTPPRGQRAVIGAGTVIDADGARRAIDAGAEFIVSPCFVPEVIEVAKAAGVVVIPGALTPTEVFAAARAGGDLVKVFPMDSLGGAAYLRALLAPFPDLQLVPTGGVDLRTVGELIRAGAVAVGVGSSLVSANLLAAGEYDTIASRARQFVSAVANARAGRV
jgi:2-dehydro-3-deoxyphosphogluconate aldolase/(4S)-4-hydroxy-2-oxoglutarate aldolase